MFKKGQLKTYFLILKIEIRSYTYELILNWALSDAFYTFIRMNYDTMEWNFSLSIYFWLFTINLKSSLQDYLIFLYCLAHYYYCRH